MFVYRKNELLLMLGTGGIIGLATEMLGVPVWATVLISAGCAIAYGTTKQKHDEAQAAAPPPVAPPTTP